VVCLNVERAFKVFKLNRLNKKDQEFLKTNFNFFRKLFVSLPFEIAVDRSYNLFNKEFFYGNECFICFNESSSLIFSSKLNECFFVCDACKHFYYLNNGIVKSDE